MARIPVKVTKNIQPPIAAGKYHRLICMTGKNKGTCYYIADKRVLMGRSIKTDIQIYDNQASREHFELARVGEDYVLTDLGSQNGVFVNDFKVSQHKLKNGDKIIVGSTVYKYSFLEVVPDVPALYEEDDEEEEEEVTDVKPRKGKNKKNSSKGRKKDNKKVLILGGVLLAVFLFVPDESEDKKKKAAPKSTQANALIDKGEKEEFTYSGDLDPALRDKLEAYIHRGRREAREGNYIRALEEFTLARTLDPRNGSVAFYINRATQRLTEKVKEINEQAFRFRSAKMYTAAHGKYCIVIKMLEQYKDNRDLQSRYEQAEADAKEMSEKMGLERNEVNCK